VAAFLKCRIKGALAKPNPYIEFLLEALRPLGTITARAMFGGHGLYCDGIFFALVARSALYLKADDVNRREFEGRQLRAFRPYEDKSEVMQYYEAPAEIFEDPDALKHWAGGAVQAGVRAQMKKAPKSSRKSGKRS
jgi:DNA transformation protein and related proteins